MADQEIDLRLDDAETIDATPELPGPTVDPEPRRATFADLMTRADERKPIVPASLRSKAGRHALLVLGVALITHSALWHASRTLLYLWRIVKWSPRGLWRAFARPIWWARAEEGNWHLRQHSALRNDPDTWLRLNAERRKDARPRLWGVAFLVLLAVVAMVLFLAFVPGVFHWPALIGVLVLLAAIGRPQDQGLFETAFNPNRYVRLTAELTRRALMAAESKIKEPGSVRFSKEIYRDGPGYTAIVELPNGIIAEDIIDKRPYLAAGFQLPIAQVWTDPVPDAHPGVLSIWVADRPVTRMKMPPSPLLTAGKMDWWGPLPYGDDVRHRPLSWRLDERNSLFGGMPGSGKTLAARNVALAAALDPLVQFAISELKGSGDFDPLAPLCGKDLYASGADEATKDRTMEILRWLYHECEVRGPKIRKWAAKGLNSQNKLNRAIAEADPSLRPILGIFDEIQELITDPERGKEAVALVTSIVKRGRSLGIHLLLSTQRIDDKSLPTGISSNVSNRCCLAVPSHKEVELVLGTGYYKKGYRPTAFVPPATGDNPWAGFGYLAGLPTPIRASYIDNNAAEQIVERAMGLRGGLAGIDLERVTPDRDVLADVIRVFAHTNRPGLHWRELAEILAGEKPALYAGLSPEALSAEVRAAGVESVNVSVDGLILKGCRRDAVQKAIEGRELADSASGGGRSLTPL